MAVSFTSRTRGQEIDVSFSSFICKMGILMACLQSFLRELNKSMWKLCAVWQGPTSFLLPFFSSSSLLPPSFNSSFSTLKSFSGLQQDTFSLKVEGKNKRRKEARKKRMEVDPRFSDPPWFALLAAIAWVRRGVSDGAQVALTVASRADHLECSLGSALTLCETLGKSFGLFEP